jgi:hypothetical protein
MLASASGNSPRSNPQSVAAVIGDAKIFIEAQTPKATQTIAGTLDVPQSFANVAQGLGEVAKALRTAVAAAVPTKLEVEFGIDLEVQPDDRTDSSRSSSKARRLPQ